MIDAIVGTTLASGGGEVVHLVHVAVGLVALACAVGVLTKFVRVPYTVALVLVGLGIALVNATPAGVVITHDLVFVVFLPPLLFQAGLHTDLGHLREEWGPVLVLAIPGVLVTSFLVALVLKPFLAAELGASVASWQVALLLGVVLAPTDPISVVSVFKSAGAPEKLKTVIEGEALFNDGTAVAIFSVLRLAVFGAGGGLAAGDEVVGLGHVAGQFVFMAGVGTVLGLGLGLVAFWVLRQLNDHTLETAITIALAWGAFVLAESLGVSGVIAVVVAALIVGNYGTVLSMSAETRRTLVGFWSSLDYLVNSVLFLLIGFELSDPAIGGVSGLVRPRVLLAAGCVVAVLLAARALVVYPSCVVLKGHWPGGWKHVIWWSGLRGSLSLALILGMPEGELRRFAVAVAFVVVLVSLVGQALTMPLVMRWSRVGGEH